MTVRVYLLLIVFSNLLCLWKGVLELENQIFFCPGSYVGHLQPLGYLGADVVQYYLQGYLGADVICHISKGTLKLLRLVTTSKGSF